MIDASSASPLSVLLPASPPQPTLSVDSFLAVSAAAAPAVLGSLCLLHLILLKIKVILLPSILLFLCLMLICSLLDWYADETQIHWSLMNSDEAATHRHTHPYLSSLGMPCGLPVCLSVNQTGVKEGSCVSSSASVSLKSLWNPGIFKFNHYKYLFLEQEMCALLDDVHTI